MDSQALKPLSRMYEASILIREICKQLYRSIRKKQPHFSNSFTINLKNGV